MANLPVLAFREEILEAVENHRVVVITAETGAGKSTQVPQFLAAAGYNVVVTQPRRLAARSVAERVAEEMSVPLGSLVGYRTGFEREDSLETQILFCTDGLQLVREITGSGLAQVLVIDEVHEWNLNIEVLVAWARKRLAEEAPFKVVLMSATLEAQKLADYFAEVTGQCPVIEVPGRLFPVERDERSAHLLVDEVKSLVAAGRNVLVFQPGKREINELIEELKGLSAEVLPLHGELSPEEQRRVFRHYDRPKVVVSTNVAQTSITIDDIDAVVDSGLERRVELNDGVEGLFLKPTSKADCEQRAGRAGRTKEGVYLLCSEMPVGRRPDFPTAEVHRTRLDQMVLRLAESGIDAAELEFFHQPDHNAIVSAKNSCLALGLMKADGKVTSMGRKAARFPVSVQIARMILEAIERNCVSEIVTIAAIWETGSLKDRENKWRSLTTESESDLLAELDLYNRARQMVQNGQRNYLADAGIFAKNYFRASELRGKIWQAVKHLVRESGQSADRQEILKSIAAGMVDHLFQKGSRGYTNGEAGSRELSNRTAIKGLSDWLVGTPFDLSGEGRRGPYTLRLIEWATKVDPEWLTEVAPQLATEGREKYRFDRFAGKVVCDLVKTFNGQEISRVPVDGEGPEAVLALATALTNGIVKHESVELNQKVLAEVSELNIRSAGTLGEIESSKLTEFYVSKLGEIYTLESALDLDLALTSADVSQMLKIEDYETEKAKILVSRPDGWEIFREEYRLNYFLNGKSLGVTRGFGFSRFSGAELVLPVEVIESLGDRQLPDFTVRIKVEGSGYELISVITPEESLDLLRARIEQKRLELAWRDFESSRRGSEALMIQVTEMLPELPEPEIYDEVTGSLAYPSFQRATRSFGSSDYSEFKYQVVWYRTSDEAQKSLEPTARELKGQRVRYEAQLEQIRGQQMMAEMLAEVQALWSQVDVSRPEDYGLTEADVTPWSSPFGSNSIPDRIRKAEQIIQRRGDVSSAGGILGELKLELEKALGFDL